MVTTRSQDGTLPSKSSTSSSKIERPLQAITNGSATNIQRRKVNKKKVVKTNAAKVAKKSSKTMIEKPFYVEPKQPLKTSKKGVKDTEKLGEVRKPSMGTKAKEIKASTQRVSQHAF